MLKSDQIRYGVSQVNPDSKTERIFAIAFLGKSSYFNRKNRLIRLFYFSKNRNFIGSRSCSNQTKLGMEYPKLTQTPKQKEFLL